MVHSLVRDLFQYINASGALTLLQWHDPCEIDRLRQSRSAGRHYVDLRLDGVELVYDHLHGHGI